MAGSNNCIYCKSGAYGPGCPFSPHKVHVHPSDSKRCIYCGSYSVGPGCPFNPHGKMHIHGIEYNQMINDSVKNSIVTGYLMDKLDTPITEMAAYKLGLIDEKGNKIKLPKTLEEKSAFTVLDQYIVDLKQALGIKLDLINSSTYMNMEEVIPLEEYATRYENELSTKKQIQRIVNELKQVFAESYQKGLSSNTIEKLIIQSLDDSN